MLIKIYFFSIQGGWSALMWAAYKGKANTVSLLLSKGADVNALGNYHISSLLWASGRGYAEIVKDLLAHGAKVNLGDKVNRVHSIFLFAI